MAQSKRKTRSNKFPLTLHPTGQYCKKIRGKLYYFGADKRRALERYLEQAAYLHTGNWAWDNEIIDTIPNLKAIKKISRPKVERPIFTIEQIRRLFECADPQMKAMIWLGLNCGFGCTDCAELRWDNLNLENARVTFPRGKTGITRNLLLWTETIAALKVIPRCGKLVFYTSKKNPWVRTLQSREKDGRIRYANNNTISKQFSKLLRKAGIEVEKGVGFYSLRRTAATLAAKSRDPFAVQRLLGHADLRMASTYVQDISAQTDQVIRNSRRFIIQGDS